MKNVFLLAVLALTFGASAREKVIFDTDMGGDVDDALALTYLLCEPECDLLGVTVEAWGGTGLHPRSSLRSAAVSVSMTAASVVSTVAAMTACLRRWRARTFSSMDPDAIIFMT